MVKYNTGGRENSVVTFGRSVGVVLGLKIWYLFVACWNFCCMVAFVEPSPLMM